MSCEPEYPVLFRRQGRRLTLQRAAVLASLRHSEGHRTAEELFEAVSASRTLSTPVSLSTVYRTLEALEEMHLVTRLAAGPSATYEWVGEESAHHHLVCDECGSVSAVQLDSVATLAREIRAQSGFEPVIRHLGIGGLCAECAARNRGEHVEQKASLESHLAGKALPR